MLFTLLCAAVTLSSLLDTMPVYGQAVSQNGGSIQGTITDPTGAIVPGASVTITDVDTASVKKLRTDGSGFYSDGPLIPGKYTVYRLAGRLSDSNGQDGHSDRDRD